MPSLCASERARDEDLQLTSSPSVNRHSPACFFHCDDRDRVHAETANPRRSNPLPRSPCAGRTG